MAEKFKYVAECLALFFFFIVLTAASNFLARLPVFLLIFILCLIEFKSKPSSSDSSSKFSSLSLSAPRKNLTPETTTLESGCKVAWVMISTSLGVLGVDVGGTRVGTQQWEYGLNQGLSGDDVSVSQHNQTLNNFLSQFRSQVSVVVGDQRFQFVREVGRFLWVAGTDGRDEPYQLFKFVTVLRAWLSHE
ncbi:hypothetical protein WICPIJ_000450 [Wickerhamomyces pijperi]|uniref:Uncharacterized protein n=1 Tax=Wickerhamomyces pijperi TaxID=599730 RepID=A0A9P8QGZ7_WICPI|nr:hypothetical protein WICPIJ_000450 [Wickerhamomyces pijperi]